MTSIGKGRGWARATENETVLRRPGQSVSPKTSEIQQLVNKIKDLGLDAPSFKQFAELMIFLENQSEDERDANLDKLWKNILEDRNFGVKYTEMCVSRGDKNCIKKNLLEPIRRSLYTNTQAWYIRREELYKEKPENVTNLTWVLGLIMFHMTNRMQLVLAQPLRNCLSLLLETPSEDDIETVAIQLYLNAKFMDENRNNERYLVEKETNDAELVDIVNRARRVLIDRNVSARSRTLLLLIIEFAHQKYEPFTGQLQAFYAAALEPTYRSEDDREFNQQSYFHELLTKGMAKNESVAIQQAPSNLIKSQQQQQPQQQPQQQQHHHQQVPQKMPQNEGNPGPVPRAIRGAGASSESSKDLTNDKKPAFRTQKNNRVEKRIGPSKTNSNNQNWGHDDRFHNDYE